MKNSSKSAAAGKEHLPSTPAELLPKYNKKDRESVPHKAVIAIAVLLVIAFCWASFLLGRAHARSLPAGDFAADIVTPCHPGPWGNLEYVPITIAAPEEYLSVQKLEHSTVRWTFPGFTLETFGRFLDTLDVTDAQKEQLLKPDAVKITAVGVELSPSASLTLALSAKSRQQLCAQLAQYRDNNPGLEAITAKSFDEHFVKSGISDSTLAMVRKYACLYRDYLVFPDFPYVVAAIPTYQEKLDLVKAISRQESLLVKLHVTPDSDINALAKYYGKACWTKDVTPILQSLSRVPGGARIDLVHLLPPLPTSLLYTFPLPNAPGSTNLAPDCHWTAFNFFRDPPDQRFRDPEFIRTKLQNDYYIVHSDLRFGDIVVFYKPDGSAIHSAVYLFDNIVFTKNGANLLQPWKLATMNQLVDLYSFWTTPEKPLRMVCYREKYY